MKFMSINLDARGLACPQPVIITKKALDNVVDGVITTVVDNKVAKENVVKYAVANNCGVSVEEQAGQYHIRITKGIPAISPQVGLETLQQRELVFLITTDSLGHGSEELGKTLMNSFLYTLTESDQLPKTILFINGGVKLAAEDSPVLNHLISLSKKGVHILACGACLDYYNIKERLAVGEVTNMYTILNEVSGSAKVVTL